MLKKILLFTLMNYYHTKAQIAGYENKTVNHGSGQYISECGSHVNSVENVWSGFKRSIKGTHIHVSKKHLGKYAQVFEYRFNARDLGVAEMFDDLTTKFQKKFTEV